MMARSVPKIYRFQPLTEDVGLRLDQYLAQHMAGLSKSLVRKVIDLGGVHVNGHRTRKCSYAIQGTENIEFYLDGQDLTPFVLNEEQVVYRDSYLLVVNKPAGIESQPTPARYRGTLYEALLNYLHNPFRPKDRPELGMVQRLDRETSGLMAFSIHKRAHRGLTRAFSGRAVSKFYLALVHGRLASPEGEFRSLLARNRASNLVRSVARGGKEAVTRYRLMEAFPEASLVEIELLTGRSHQIRAHFSEAGHPLLGDLRYGGPAQCRSFTVDRQMLHAHRLALPHPVSGELLQFEVPAAQDFACLLSILRQAAAKN